MPNPTPGAARTAAFRDRNGKWSVVETVQHTTGRIATHHRFETQEAAQAFAAGEAPAARPAPARDEALDSTLGTEWRDQLARPALRSVR